MSQGVNVPDKPPFRGRGRGMARKTSHEEGPIMSDDTVGPNDEQKSESSTNSREVKVRRTKAGYEPYQVKKKLPVVQDEQVKVSSAERPRTSSRGSSSGDRKPIPSVDHKHSPSSDHRSRSFRDHKQSPSDGRKSGSSGDRRHSSGERKLRNDYQDDESNKKRNGNRNRNRTNSSFQEHRKHQQKKSTDSKVPSESKNKKDSDNQSSPMSTTSKQIHDNIKTNSDVSNENNEEDSRKLKQKVLGHSILQCPCMCSLPEGCMDCSPNSKPTSAAKPKTDGNKNKLTGEQAVIDTKFLVASPVSVPKVRSVLESESESEVGNIDDMDHFDTLSNLSPSKSMTHEEINALFKNTPANTIPQVRIHENSLETDMASRTDNDSMGSDTHISISSSSEPSNSRKTSLDSEFLSETVSSKQSTKTSTTKSEQRQPRQRNVLNNIVSILNENKTLENNSRQTVKGTEQKVLKRSTRENQDRSQNRRNEKKKNKQDSRKKSNQKNEHLNSEQNDVDNKQKGFILLPDSTYISKSVEEKSETRNNSTPSSPSNRHVHFSAEDQRKSSKSEKEASVKTYLRTIESFQKEMKNFFKKRFEDVENITDIIKISENIQHHYGELITHFQEYAFRHDFESAMWKSAFHNIITKFREFFDSKESESKQITQSIGSLYWKFLQNGIQYLDALTSQLQEQCDFNLDEYFEDPIRMQRCNKQVKFALRSCHLLLIYIGDLERYISQLQQEDNYSQAQLCYKQAQMLAPKNGKSYNQLAVVAVLTKRKLDAVYYYTRSLQASNPILTAKDRLTAIFHDIKKKVEVFKQSYQPESFQNFQNSQSDGKIPNEGRSDTRKFNKDHLRDEIWIFLRHGQMFKVMLTDLNDIVYLTPPPKGIQNKKTAPKIPTHHKQDKLSLRKINRGFIIFFLSIHCKLYTNIGLEEFTATHQDTLSNFATLLEHPKASSMKEESILKYMAINIFSIHNLLEKNNSTDVIPNTALDFALVFSVDMFTVLCKHCTKLLNTKGLSSVDQFLPSVRIWLLWMLDNAELVMKSSVSSMLDIWSEICGFFNLFNSLECEQQQNGSSVGEKNVYLNEDIFLAGFKPCRSQLKHCPADSQHEVLICRQLRVESVNELISELDEAGKLPFAYDESEKVYKAVQSTTQVFTSPVKKVKDLELDSTGDEDDDEIDDDVILEDVEEEEDYGDGSNLNALKAQKAELTRLLEDNEKKKSEALAVIESHKAEGRHMSENSPSYLVADTNCFIDHLQFVEKLLDSKDFNIVVPLIVINELDGLKKGSFTPDQISAHNRNVQQAAGVAIDMLEDRFSRHDPNLRSITSSGNELTTIVFRAEELSNDRGTNDDVILSCCLKYCKEYISRNEGESNVIRRDVVLLTDDRNLRLKAHSRFVPTVSIETFMKMAQFL